MYDLLEDIAFDYAFDGEIEKAAALTSYSDLYNLLINLRGATPLVALDAIKELQRAFRDMNYSEKEEIIQYYFACFLDVDEI